MFREMIRISSKFLLPGALLALASLTPAHAFAADGSIDGQVTAQPAKFLAETVVYIEHAPTRPQAVTAMMNQKGMKFLPHLLTVQVGDSVRFVNSDNVQHNVMSPDHGGYNKGMIDGGKSSTQVFSQTGAYAQLCSVHPEMLAYIFVSQNPHAVAVDASGKFHLGGVPAGTYQLAVWNAHLKGASQTVTVTGGAAAHVDMALKR